MLPEFLPQYSVGPFFGFAANAVMSVLCLVTLALYRHYRPLRSLFLFYLFSTFLFLGWVIYGLQKSPESILLGYRIDLAALALLPASWAWFDSALSNQRPNWLPRAMTGISLFLAGLALFGQGPWFLGLPLVPHEIASDILRPQSRLLRPLIHFFGLSICLFYFLLTIKRIWRSKNRRPVYLLPFGIGMLFWLMGGLHDAIRSAGVAILIEDQVSWFTSFGLSVFLTIAVTFHFRSLEQAVREARDVFERFVPPAYLRRIAAKGLGSIRLGEADQQWVTILCCDIRGFTALSERLNPSQLVSFVNRLYERITRVVEEHQGVIDKFLGDSVLSIFEGTDSAERAVACGVDMLAAVQSFNAEEDQPSDQAVRIGIGLHTGLVILGTIGSSERMDSTVLGVTVNLAKRLEEITRRLGVDMLISEQVANRLPEGHNHRFRRLGEVSIRGSSSPMGIVEVYDHDPTEVRKLKDRTEPLMAEGIELLKTGHLEVALSKFKEAQSILPQDPALQFFINSLKEALEKGQAIKGTALIDLR
jgi:class 3 adenylate cyclase